MTSSALYSSDCSGVMTQQRCLGWRSGRRTLSINQLVDMEWKFGVTAASSEVEKAGSIFLQLKMVIRKGSKLEPVYVGESICSPSKTYTYYYTGFIYIIIIIIQD
ncbi:unnamed protein product, partial [Staurois parvus]